MPGGRSTREAKVSSVVVHVIVIERFRATDSPQSPMTCDIRASPLHLVREPKSVGKPQCQWSQSCPPCSLPAPPPPPAHHAWRLAWGLAWPQLAAAASAAAKRCVLGPEPAAKKRPRSPSSSRRARLSATSPTGSPQGKASVFGGMAAEAQGKAVSPGANLDWQHSAGQQRTRPSSPDHWGSNIRLGAERVRPGFGCPFVPAAVGDPAGQHLATAAVPALHRAHRPIQQRESVFRLLRVCR